MGPAFLASRWKAAVTKMKSVTMVTPARGTNVKTIDVIFPKKIPKLSVARKIVTAMMVRFVPRTGALTGYATTLWLRVTAVLIPTVLPPTYVPRSNAPVKTSVSQLTSQTVVAMILNASKSSVMMFPA